MANSIEEVRNSLPSNNLKGEKQSISPISYEDIAKKLLNEKLLLTALELHVELCEANKELPLLKDFFSNPSNFELQNIKPEPYVPMPRSSSQGTLDSLDMTRYSEDGGMDERVAVLEFELRKARENINALRANLTVVTESDGNGFDKKSEKQLINEHPIKPHEQRALNFLVNEYLLARSYKLTSITFSDENENQDFEDWQDVGLNIPKPPELLQIYREFMKASGHDKPISVNVALQTEVDDSRFQKVSEELNKASEEIERLSQKIISLEEEKSELQRLFSNTSVPSAVAESNSEAMQTINSNSTTPDKFELLESLPQDISTVTQDIEEDDSGSIVVSLGETDPGDKEWTRIQLPRIDVTDNSTNLLISNRYLPSRFRNEVLAHYSINASSAATAIIEEPLKNGVTQEKLVNILAHTLPRIIPNVLLNKREESIPLILSTIRLHDNSMEREKLLQLLFNLKKKPQEEERNMILAGLITMAKLNDELTEHEEILTLCWEQSQHKYTERRLLAAECCSALAPYTPSNIRNSLMLSMLQQMLVEDKEPTVRATVVKSLALLVALMDDPDKYFQCEELAVTALDDVSSAVIDAASSILLPILAQWALTLRRLLSHLLPRVIAKLRSQLTHQFSPSKEQPDIEKSMASITVMQHLLPHTVVCVVDNDIIKLHIKDNVSSKLSDNFLGLCFSNICNPKVFYESEIDIGILLNTFFSDTWENVTWPELNWLTDTLIPKLIDIFKCVDVTQELLINKLLTYIRSLCLGFGRHITEMKIQTAFKIHISELENQLMQLSSDQKDLKLSLIPAYLTIVSTLDGTEMANLLKHFLVALSISGNSMTSLRVAVTRLCTEIQLQEYVLTGLWDGVVHQRSTVKCATAMLLSGVVSRVSERLVNTRIIPAIVTLANDTDINVRAAAIPALGRLVTDCNAREAEDKARLTLETIARESHCASSLLAVPLVLTLGSIAPHCPQNYIEDVIATQLSNITAAALQQGRKIELANALIEAYSILVYCPLSNQCVTGALAVGLGHLDMLVSKALPQQRDTVRSLIKEVESRQDAPRMMERSSSTSSGLSLSMATVNVGQGMEDMRQRVSKIFQQKGNSSSVSSIFRKK